MKTPVCWGNGQDPTQGHRFRSRSPLSSLGVVVGEAWVSFWQELPPSSCVCSPPPQTEVPGTATSAILGPLSSSTTYMVRVTCLYPGGSSSTLTGRLTTREWQSGWGPQATSLCSPR